MPASYLYRQKAISKLYKEPLGDGIELELVLIPAGTFTMGSPAFELQREESEGPQHPVEISKFYMGRFPVTQEQWRAVSQFASVNRDLKLEPSYFNDDKNPVEQVSWHEAMEFCDRLTAHSKYTYHLPTEAEWEYACRGRTPSPFYCGQTISTNIANYNGSYTYGEEDGGKNRRETTPVNHFEMTNPFGLSDMHGNVLEWCLDHWHENYNYAPIDGKAWLTNDENADRILRGGSWLDVPGDCRSASRTHYNPDFTFNRIGFRIVLAPR
ncbi:formylglycine-generating enzyme family protein [Acaryochloris sp. IP29b_bin.137]|uniref:formylglycine-generating enzyme family protein n=1 Tax=Acaryochloris sp. IP29b_bin.137 TaxID=2969217 RepID=UPI00261B3394|nr:formylglycine-generating enzyme family protein [Acaryochloris sp. IP29b_bin.137]